MTEHNKMQAQTRRTVLKSLGISATVAASGTVSGESSDQVRIVETSLQFNQPSSEDQWNYQKQAIDMQKYHAFNDNRNAITLKGITPDSIHELFRNNQNMIYQSGVYTPNVAVYSGEIGTAVTRRVDSRPTEGISLDQSATIPKITVEAGDKTSVKTQDQRFSVDAGEEAIFSLGEFDLDLLLEQITAELVESDIPEYRRAHKTKTKTQSESLELNLFVKNRGVFDIFDQS